MKYDMKELLQNEETAKNAPGKFPAADKKAGERIYKLTTEKLAAKRGLEGASEAYTVTRVTRSRRNGAFAAAAAAVFAVGLAAGGVALSREQKTVPAVDDAPVIVNESSEPVSGAPKERPETATSASDDSAENDVANTHTAPEKIETATSPSEEKPSPETPAVTSPSDSKPAENKPASGESVPPANEAPANETPEEPAPETTDARLLYLKENDDPDSPLVTEREVLEHDMSLFQVKNLLSLRRREIAENCKYEWLEREFLNSVGEYDIHADLSVILELAHEAMGDYELTELLTSYMQPCPDKTYSDANGNEVREYWVTGCDSVTVSFYPAEKRIVYRGPDLNEKNTVYIEKDIVGGSDPFLYPFAPDSSIERRRAAYDKVIEEYKDYYPNGTPLRKLMIATGTISPDRPRLSLEKFNSLLETCENSSDLWRTLYFDYVPDVAGHNGPNRSGTLNSSNYEYWLDDECGAAIVITLSGEYYYTETTYGCVPGETRKLELPWK